MRFINPWAYAGRYLACAVAVFCETCVLFLLCLTLGIGWGLYMLGSVLSIVCNVLVFGLVINDRHELKSRRLKSTVATLGEFVILVAWLLPFSLGTGLLDGSINETDYEIVRRLPCVESYMDENGMLDDYYGAVARGFYDATPEEIAWAEGHLAD